MQAVIYLPLAFVPATVATPNNKMNVHRFKCDIWNHGLVQCTPWHHSWSLSLHLVKWYVLCHHTNAAIRLVWHGGVVWCWILGLVSMPTWCWGPLLQANTRLIWKHILRWVDSASKYVDSILSGYNSNQRRTSSARTIIASYRTIISTTVHWSLVLHL